MKEKKILALLLALQLAFSPMLSVLAENRTLDMENVLQVTEEEAQVMVTEEESSKTVEEEITEEIEVTEKKMEDGSDSEEDSEPVFLSDENTGGGYTSRGGKDNGQRNNLLFRLL